jgi:prefoldin subunit 5
MAEQDTNAAVKEKKEELRKIKERRQALKEEMTQLSEKEAQLRREMEKLKESAR